MKKLILLLFSLLLSFNSYGEWTEIPELEGDYAERGFIDFDNLKKRNDGYVYWWMMTSRSDSSEKYYTRADCEDERMNPLQGDFHDEPMGQGDSTSTLFDEGWTYPAPDTGMYRFLEVVCEMADENPEQRARSVENFLMSLEYKNKINNLYEKEMELEDNHPSIISIDENLNYYISPFPLDESIPEAISYDELINIASDRMMANPEMKVWINADKKIDYGKVLEVVTPLKKFNNPIGFLTEATEDAIIDSFYGSSSPVWVPPNAQRVGNTWYCDDGYERHNNGCRPTNQDRLDTLKSAYVSNIASRVKSYWRYQGAEDDWTCEVYIVQDRDGTVVAVDVRNCNNDDSPKAKSFQNSVKRAVYKASPLPSAPDEAVFDDELVIKFSVN